MERRRGWYSERSGSLPGPPLVTRPRAALCHAGVGRRPGEDRSTVPAGHVPLRDLASNCAIWANLARHDRSPRGAVMESARGTAPCSSSIVTICGCTALRPPQAGVGMLSGLKIRVRAGPQRASRAARLRGDGIADLAWRSGVRGQGRQPSLGSSACWPISPARRTSRSRWPAAGRSCSGSRYETSRRSAAARRTQSSLRSRRM